ncbi:penicillin-binding transpeptidase domain-containing protein [Virgibacillus sp. MSP4-1]|uniref:penicillin-binding transpeptidase domain-containing protein n=1 Tax=Virgibacillus sp. MSP4-1 TaxID=2700081 RepID=UPI0003A82F4F|nr:penicillin-binding transpeptidase domain-containing protein [Virgibacillus sp. MSP4-1]QHS23244.1 penicillin-binding transpeptidase domain-containing protein [Virgibacillus sp. MSP4-1]
MKRKWMLFSAILLLSFLGACKGDQVTPDERLSEYISLWNEEKFDQMYEDYLSSTAKENYAKEDMAGRYKDLYSDLEINDIKVSFEKPSDDEQPDYEEVKEASFPIHVEMESIAGPVSFDHELTLVKETREEEENWYVNWDTTYIFKQLEDGDEVGLDTTSAPRGQIFDRNGNGLAINDTLPLMGIKPSAMEGHEQETIKALSEQLHLDVEYIEQQLNQDWVQPNLFVPLRTINPNNQELFDKLMALPGVFYKDQVGRYYPLGEAAAHLVGYTGDITAEELEEHEDDGYSAQDKIGKRGLELLYEEKLRGESGAEITIQKANGQKVTVASKKAKAGQDIRVTIDAEVQKTIYNQMNQRQGSAAAIHPKTGETLALVSSPSFDPNGLTSNAYAKLMEDETKPLLNRFTSLYAPGSTFKPVTAMIGLSSEAITPDQTRNIKGETWKKQGWGNYEVRRVTDPGHPVNLEDALVYSDNIYFAQTALDIGADHMVSGLKKFGFNEEIPYSYGIPQSKISNSGNLNEEILLADTGYGQGELQVSILHLATMFTPIINEGNLIKPQLLAEQEPEVWKENLVSAEQAEYIHQALRKVVSSPNGTARGANIQQVPLAGKTGTAELKSSQDDEGKENGLFVAYDSENQNLLISMLLENVQDDGGSTLAVERVTEVFKELYK